MANLTPDLLNGVQSTVQAGSSAIGSASATGINVATGDGAAFGTIGTNQFIPAVVLDSTGATIKEYVWITARSTDALTVVRQAEDSTRFPASTTSIQAGYQIKAVATKAGLAMSPGRTMFRADDHNYLTWTTDPATLPGTTAPSLGVIYLTKLAVPVTMAVSNVVFMFGTAGSGLTTGQNFAAIYDSSGTRLAVSADQTTNLGGAGAGPFSVAMTGAPITITGGPGVFVYAALLINGTTAPQFFRLSVQSTSATIPNAGLTSGTYRAMGFSGNTSMPATLTLTSGVQNILVLWAALS